MLDWLYNFGGDIVFPFLRCLHLSCNGQDFILDIMDCFGSQTLANVPFTNMTINGAPVATIQNVGNVSFA